MSLLEVRDVTVRFGGLWALQGVNLEVEAATLTGLIGPNGAGKTTLFNVICGYELPTTGSVAFDGSDIGMMPPHRRVRLGIARTFQRLETFGSLSARENVRVAAEARRRWSRDRSDVEETTERILELVGLRAVADEQVDALPTGLARLVELGRALATKPRLLLLDEPSSGLDEQESDALGELLVDLARAGTAVLLVEHDVDLVMRVCAKVFVLNFGTVLAAGPPDRIRSDPAVRAAYLGVSQAASGVAARSRPERRPGGPGSARSRRARSTRSLAEGSVG
jgi:branched-chain amino acid transport system ATP-binding protein